MRDIINKIDSKEKEEIKTQIDLESEPVRELEPWGEFWEDKKRILKSYSEYK